MNVSDIYGGPGGSHFLNFFENIWGSKVIFFDEKIVSLALENFFFSVTIQDREMIFPTLCLAKMGKYYRLCDKSLLYYYVIMMSSTAGIFLRNLSKNSLFPR